MSKTSADKYVDDIISLMNKENSLANLSRDALDAIIKDGRTSLFEVVDKDQKNLMLELIKKYSSYEFDLPEDLFTKFNVLLYRHRKFNWQNINPTTRFNFLFRILLRSETVKTNGTIHVPFFYYLAATYKGYTLDMVREHIEEIKGNLHVGEIDPFKKDSHVELYLEIMNEYNNSLPDDLKIWLKLR